MAELKPAVCPPRAKKKRVELQEQWQPSVFPPEKERAEARRKYWMLWISAFFIHILLFTFVVDLNFKSPVHTGLTPHQTLGKPFAKRIVVLIADGLRAEALYTADHAKRTPHLTFIRNNQSSWGTVHTRVPTESRPGHVAILGGLYEDPSAIFTGWKANIVPFDSVINQSNFVWAYGSPDIVNIFTKQDSETLVAESYDADDEDFSGRTSTINLDTWVFDKVEALLQPANNSSCRADQLHVRFETRKYKNLLNALQMKIDQCAKNRDNCVYNEAKCKERYQQCNDNLVEERRMVEVKALEVKFLADDTANNCTTPSGTDSCGALCKNGNLFFLHLLGMDSAGHIHKPESKEYIENLKAIDEGIQRVVDMFEDFFDDGETTYLFTSDHGMTDWGSHGDGSTFETEVPYIIWGKGIQHNIHPIDMEQADLAPLISSVIGIPIPINSVGILHEEVFDKEDEQRVADAVFTNLRQLSERYLNFKSQFRHDPFFYDHKPFRGEEYNVQSIIENFSLNEFNNTLADNIPLMKFMIKELVKSLDYMRSYYYIPKLLCVITGFVLWLAYLILSLHCTYEVIPPEPQAWKRNIHIGLAYFIISFGIVVYLFALEAEPLAYVYAAFPLYVIICIINEKRMMQQAGRVFRRLKGKRMLHRVILFIIMNELLVYGFFNKYSCGVVLWVLGMWLQEAKITKSRRICWMLCCIALSSFLLMPPTTKFAYLGLFFGGIIWLTFYLLIVFTRYIDYLDFNLMRNIYFFYSISFLPAVYFMLAMINTYIVAYTFDNEQGVHYWSKFASWILTVMPMILIPLSHNSILIRFGQICGCLIIPYTLLSINIDLVVYTILVAMLILWILIESELVEVFIPVDVAQYMWEIPERELLITNIYQEYRRTYFYLALTICYFFAIGNLASFNGFDPLWARAYVTTFNPFLMAGLIIFKMIIPFFIITCAFYGVQLITGADTTKTFTMLLIFCDQMVLNFMLLVKNEGSWKEIGTSLSHFVIIEVMVLIILIFYAIAKFVTTTRIATHLGKYGYMTGYESSDEEGGGAVAETSVTEVVSAQEETQRYGIAREGQTEVRQRSTLRPHVPLKTIHARTSRPVNRFRLPLDLPENPAVPTVIPRIGLPPPPEPIEVEEEEVAPERPVTPPRPKTPSPPKPPPELVIDEDLGEPLQYFLGKLYIDMHGILSRKRFLDFHIPEYWPSKLLTITEAENEVTPDPPIMFEKLNRLTYYTEMHEYEDFGGMTSDSTNTDWEYTSSSAVTDDTNPDDYTDLAEGIIRGRSHFHRRGVTDMGPLMQCRRNDRNQRRRIQMQSDLRLFGQLKKRRPKPNPNRIESPPLILIGPTEAAKLKKYIRDEDRKHHLRQTLPQGYNILKYLYTEWTRYEDRFRIPLLEKYKKKPEPPPESSGETDSEVEPDPVPEKKAQKVEAAEDNLFVKGLLNLFKAQENIDWEKLNFEPVYEPEVQCISTEPEMRALRIGGIVDYNIDRGPYLKKSFWEPPPPETPKPRKKPKVKIVRFEDVMIEPGPYEAMWEWYLRTYKDQIRETYRAKFLRALSRLRKMPDGSDLPPLVVPEGMIVFPLDDKTKAHRTNLEVRYLRVWYRRLMEFHRGIGRHSKLKHRLKIPLIDDVFFVNVKKLPNAPRKIYIPIKSPVIAPYYSYELENVYINRDYSSDSSSINLLEVVPAASKRPRRITRSKSYPETRFPITSNLERRNSEPTLDKIEIYTCFPSPSTSSSDEDEHVVPLKQSDGYGDIFSDHNSFDEEDEPLPGPSSGPQPVRYHIDRDERIYDIYKCAESGINSIFEEAESRVAGLWKSDASSNSDEERLSMLEQFQNAAAVDITDLSGFEADSECDIEFERDITHIEENRRKPVRILKTYIREMHDEKESTVIIEEVIDDDEPKAAPTGVMRVNEAGDCIEMINFGYFTDDPIHPQLVEEGTDTESFGTAVATNVIDEIIEKVCDEPIEQNVTATVTKETATITEEPATITEEPTTITEEPATVTEEPAVVTEDPDVVSEKIAYKKLIAKLSTTAVFEEPLGLETIREDDEEGSEGVFVSVEDFEGTFVSAKTDLDDESSENEATEKDLDESLKDDDVESIKEDMEGFVKEYIEGLTNDDIEALIKEDVEKRMAENDAEEINEEMVGFVKEYVEGLTGDDVEELIKEEVEIRMAKDSTEGSTVEESSDEDVYDSVEEDPFESVEEYLFESAEEDCRPKKEDLEFSDTESAQKRRLKRELAETYRNAWKVQKYKKGYLRVFTSECYHYGPYTLPLIKINIDKEKADSVPNHAKRRVTVTGFPAPKEIKKDKPLPESNENAQNNN